MDVKEKLVGLIFESLCRHIHKSCKLAENIADDLISNGVTVQEWISVKDRLPEKDQKVVFYNYSYDAVYAGRFNYIGVRGTIWFRVGKTSYSGNYWMPLPEPPKEDF